MPKMQMSQRAKATAVIILLTSLYTALSQASVPITPNNVVDDCLLIAEEMGVIDNTPVPRSITATVTGTACFRFELQAANTVDLILRSDSDKIRMALGDASGNLIEFSGADSQIARDLQPGNYTLLVIENLNIIPRSQPAKKENGIAVVDFELEVTTQFMVNELIVSDPEAPLPDPEFDQQGYQATWQDKLGQLWVAPIEPISGALQLDASILLDTDLAPIPSYRKRTGTGNGPEWIYTETGAQILYTKSFGPTPDDWYVYKAHSPIPGVWEVGALPELFLIPGSSSGLSPIGSLNANDPNPRVLYLLPSKPNDATGLAWRDLDQATGEQIALITEGGYRWVDQKSEAVVYMQRVDGFEQIFYFDIASQTSTQLTFGNLHRSNPFMWRAPEHNNEMLLMVSEGLDSPKDSFWVGIYRKKGDTWIGEKLILPPSRKDFIRSAEPFVYNGKSYVSMLAEDEKTLPSEVWIAGIDPEQDFYRQVSDPTVEMVRNDPESFITESGVFIYYTERRVSVVYKADTGLGAPLP